MRLIDADQLDAAMLRTAQWLAGIEMLGAEHILKTWALPLIEDAPTIDAVPVVRCIACQFSREMRSIPGMRMCILHDTTFSELFYCAKGFRPERVTE